MNQREPSRNAAGGTGSGARQRVRSKSDHKEFGRTLCRDLKGLYYFYLDESQQARLRGMGRFRRWLLMTVWLTKNLILSLTPTRRILLLAGAYLHFLGFQASGAQPAELFESIQEHLGFLLILVVLMLELKDKLLAHDELEVGRSVQRALMPDNMPVVPGWSIWLSTRPANEVGGDLVDYLPVCRGRIGLVLADVAGKGLGAALLMAKLQATLRALSSETTSLAELGARINSIFVRDGLPNRFATMVAVGLKADSGSIRIFNAGHLPPLLLKRDGLEKLSNRSLPLGIRPDATFNEIEMDLRPGELLVIYSDGLTEARNEEGAFFGEERLAQLIPGMRDLTPEQIGTRLLDETAKFVGDAGFNDDLSLVILRRKA